MFSLVWIVNWYQVVFNAVNQLMSTYDIRIEASACAVLNAINLYMYKMGEKENSVRGKQYKFKMKRFITLQQKFDAIKQHEHDPGKAIIGQDVEMSKYMADFFGYILLYIITLFNLI